MKSLFLNDKFFELFFAPLSFFALLDVEYCFIFYECEGLWGVIF